MHPACICFESGTKALLIKLDEVTKLTTVMVHTNALREGKVAQVKIFKQNCLSFFSIS